MKYLLYTCMFLTLFGCKKDNGKNDSLTGKWKLAVYAFSPGGPMIEREADPTKPSFIEFFSNGVYRVTPAVENGADQYEINGDRITFTSSVTGSSYIQRYTIQNGVLTLVPVQPVCIEGCYTKYVR